MVGVSGGVAEEHEEGQGPVYIDKPALRQSPVHLLAALQAFAYFFNETVGYLVGHWVFKYVSLASGAGFRPVTKDVCESPDSREPTDDV